MINYDFFEIVTYQNSVINHNSNLNIIKTFNEFIDIFSKSNLVYIITGSFAISLLTKKVYRTWKDIDVIYVGSLHSYLELLPVGKWYYNDFDTNRLSVYNIKNNNYIEFLKDTNQDYIKKTYIETSTSIKIKNLQSILDWKNSNNDPKHLMDIARINHKKDLDEY